MSDAIIGIIAAIIGVVFVGAIIWSIVDTKLYTKRQIESGEDKMMLINFAKSLFKQPENYTYAVGNYTKTETRGRTTTYYYFPYMLAFSQDEFHIIAFKSVDHKPVCRNIVTFDFAEMQLTHKRKKKHLEINLFYAGETQPIIVSDIVKGQNIDKSDTPFAVEQAREVQLLEQMLMQYEQRSYQIQMANKANN